MEAFDLALGLWMVWFPVLLSDLEDGQEVLVGVLPAPRSCGVDAAVVGQCRRWSAVGVTGGEELFDDDVPVTGLWAVQASR